MPEPWHPSSVWTSPGSRGQQASRLSNQIVRLVRRYAGRGPTKSRVTINTDCVVAVMQDLLTEGERALVAAGQTEAAKGFRKQLGDLMADDAKRLVEQELGRTVIAYLRDCDPEADCATFVFVLDPPSEDGRVEGGTR